MTQQSLSKSPRQDAEHDVDGDFLESFEKTRAALLSTVVAYTKEIVDRRQQRSTQMANDPFWIQINELLTQHEAQIDQIAKNISAMRASIAKSRKAAAEKHASKVEKAKAQLASLQKDIAELQQKSPKEQSEAILEKEKLTRQKIISIQKQTKEASEEVIRLRSVTAELRGKLETDEARAEAKATTLRARKQKATEEAKRVDDEIRNLKEQIAQADSEMEELLEQRKIMSEIIASMKAPLDIVKRMSP